MRLGLRVVDVGVRQSLGLSCSSASPGSLNALGEIRHDQREHFVVL